MGYISQGKNYKFMRPSPPKGVYKYGGENTPHPSLKKGPKKGGRKNPLIKRAPF